jgi:S-layer homology domain
MHKLRKLIALLGVVAISSTLVVSTATAGEWYEPFMQNLVDVSVDFGDPGTSTTRCEWADGTVAWNDLTAEMPAEATFLDVPETHDCYEAMEIAYAHGVLSGYSDSEGAPTGYVGPSDLITREQAAKMVIGGEDLPVIEDSGLFPDESDFSSWAKDEWYHSTVFAWNKMVGDSDTGNFRPKDNINHAEAAKVITMVAELSASYIEDDDVPDDVLSDGDLLVELSDDTPAGDTVPSNASSVVVAAWDFTAQDGDVVLDDLKVHTHGVTSLPSGHAVYLYLGDDRLTSGKSVNSSTNLANFTNINLLIEDGETVTLFLRVDVGTATQSSEMGFEVEMAEHVDGSGATVTGDFPLMSETFGISTVAAGIITIEKNGTITNPKVGEDDVVIAKFKMSTSGEAAELEQVGLLITGNVSNDSVENLELYVAGEADPIATVDGLNSKDIANFVLETQYDLAKGDTKSFTVKADFNTGRTADTVKVYVDETTDILAVGGTYGFGMAVDINNASGYDGTTAACTSSAGTCSYSVLEGGDITVSSAGPTASDIATAGDDIHLLDFSLVSVSDITFKNFPIGLTASEGAAAQGLLNATTSNFTDIKIVNVDTDETMLGPIDADNLLDAVGSAIHETTGNTDALKAFYTFTDEFNMEEGEELNLAITADVENLAALDGMTLVASLELGASLPEIRDVNNKVINNADSLVPSSLITGKTMTVQSPALTATLSAVPVAGSTSRVKGEQDVPFTGVALECGSASACRVTDILLQGYLDDNGNASAFSATGTGADWTTVLNEYVGSVWLEDGAGEVVAAAQSVESDGDVQFSNMSWELEAGESVIFYVVGNISADAFKNTDAENIAFGLATAGDIDYEDDDGNSRDNLGTVNTTPTAWVTTSEGGSLTVTVDASTMKEDIVVGGVMGQEISSFKFTTTDEAFLVKKLSINARQSGIAIAAAPNNNLGDYDNNIGAVVLSYTNSDGDTETKTGYMTNGTASFSGMDFWIDQDDDAVLTVTANISSVAASNATAGEFIDLNIAFDDFEAVAQNSGETYKGDKIDAGVGAASDLDFGAIAWTDSTDTTATGDLVGSIVLGESVSFTMDAAGAAVDQDYPAGTLLCMSDDDTGTTCEADEDIYVVTATSPGALLLTVTATLLDDAGDGTYDDGDDVFYALPGTGYMTNAKQMHVYEANLSAELSSSSPSAGNKNLDPADRPFIFTLEETGGVEDVTFRQAQVNLAETTADVFQDAALAGSWTTGTASATGTGLDGGEYMIGGADAVYTFTVAADLTGYAGLSVWARESNDALTVDINGATPATALGSITSVGTEWVFIDVPFSALVTANLTTVTAIDINSAGGTVNADNLTLYTEKIVVNAISSADFDTSTADSADNLVAYLKDGNSTEFQGYWYSATQAADASNISATLYPVSGFEISQGATKTLALQTDTGLLIDEEDATVDSVTFNMNLGASTDGTVTPGGIWWYESNAVVKWLGEVANTTLNSNVLDY